MTADGSRDPWLDRLATRLKRHYGAAAADAGDDSALHALLQSRVHALRGLVADGTARYRIGSAIARGGMAKVFEAHDAALNRTVAIKVARELDDSKRQQLRLLTESSLVGKLQHPGIVPVLDVGIDATGAPFLVMPRIDGRSLADILRDDDGDWSLARRIEVLRRICEAMAYAHSCGIVHRDLKPANVMIGAYGEVYVMDWGLARSADDLTQPQLAAADGSATANDIDVTIAGTVLGTPAYLSPERAAGEDHNAEQAVLADIYSTGAMLYELLTGDPPYVCERADWTMTEILATVRERPPRAIANVAPNSDRELTAIAERAMQRDPLRRYPSMAALADDLRAWSEDRVVAAHGATASQRLRKWIRRNRRVAATVAAAAVLLVAVTTWYVLSLATARNQAVASAAAASNSLREVLDLAVVQRIADLRRRADAELWPAIADRTAAMQRWLTEAESLRPHAERLRARRRHAAEANATDDTEAKWRSRLLDEALGELDAFFAPAADQPQLPLDSTPAGVAARITFANRLQHRSVDSEIARAAWREAADYMSGQEHYRDLACKPQSGLLPLGPDPTTGLLEFAHLQSGAPAGRAADGTLRLLADTGIVLVLLPGGTFAMGANPTGARNVDPLAETINEMPVHNVTLAPFLLSKFELTQAQWQRVTGSNPSVHTARSTYVLSSAAPRHPVESVDWQRARSVLHKLGLRLPTEAQWEYAARANSSTPWYCGTSVTDLLSPPAGNFADATSADALGVQGWMPTPGLRDGFVMHAPVGSFAPNAFGLFDMIGNVAEWCDDEYLSYERPAAQHTGGRRDSEQPTTAMYRGGRV